MKLEIKGKIKRLRAQVKNNLKEEDLTKICDKCEDGFDKLIPGLNGDYCRGCYCLLAEIECKFISGTLRKE